MPIPRLQRLVRPGPGLAICLVLLSSLLYSLGYALSKRLIETWHFDAMQLFVLRSLLVLGGLAVWHLSGRRGLSMARLLSPPQPWTQRLGAACLVVSAVMAMIGYGHLPVTTATAFSYTTPLLVTIFAATVLREPIPAQRWLAVALGFAGVVVIIHPGAGGGVSGGTGHLIGIGAALASAVLYAVQQLIIRHARDSATTADVVAQAAIIGLVLLGAAMPFVWRSVPLSAMVLIVAATAAQTGGLLTIAAAIRQGQISQLAPWQYGGMIWAMGLDIVMFGHVPGAVALCGAAMIVMGGLLSQIRLSSGTRRVEARR